jgi:hypothetical protein
MINYLSFFLLFLTLEISILSIFNNSVILPLYLLAMTFVWPVLITYLSKTQPSNSNKYFLSLYGTIFVFIYVQLIFYLMPKSLNEFTSGLNSKNNILNLLIILIFLSVTVYQQIDLKLKMTTTLTETKKNRMAMEQIFQWLSPPLFLGTSFLLFYFSRLYLSYILFIIVFVIILPETVFLFEKKERNINCPSKVNFLYGIYCTFLHLIAGLLFVWFFRQTLTKNVNDMNLLFAAIWVLIGLVKISFICGVGEHRVSIDDKD